MDSSTMMVNLHITVERRVSEHLEYLAGWVREMGTYIYAYNEPSLFSQAQAAFLLWADAFPSREKLIEYMDKRGFPFEVNDRLPSLSLEPGTDVSEPREVPVALVSVS